LQLTSADWLAHLVGRRREQGEIEPHPRQLAEQARRRRAEADGAIIALLSEQLSGDVFDQRTVQDYLDRRGPFDREQAELTLERLFERGEQRDRHVSFYLDAIRNAERGEDR